MTSSIPNIDPVQVEQSLKDKRKQWKKRKQADTQTAEDDEPTVTIVGNAGQDWEEIVLQPDQVPSQAPHSSSSHVYQWVVVMEHQRGFVLC